MRIKIFFTFLCIFSLFRCADIKKNKDSVEEDILPVIIDVAHAKESSAPLKISEIAESISYIKIPDEPLLRDITTSRLKIIDDTIYIDMDNGGNIYKYTPKGEFKTTLFVEGQGRGEVVRYLTEPAAFNAKERYVSFNGQGGYVSYSFDGTFLEKKDDYINGNFKKIETYFNDYCLYSIDHNVGKDIGGNRLGSHLFYAEDLKTGNIFYAYPNPAASDDPIFNGRNDLVPADMNIFSIDSILWFKHYAMDTLFSTHDLITISPQYIFRTDNSFMNIHDYVKFKVNALENDRYSTKVMRGVLPLPTGDLLFTISGKLALADKQGDIINYSDKAVLNNLDHYLKEFKIAHYLELRTFSIYNNHLYFLVDAFEFLEEGCNTPFESITEESNPIIVKLKLKTH